MQPTRSAVELLQPTVQPAATAATTTEQPTSGEASTHEVSAADGWISSRRRHRKGGNEQANQAGDGRVASTAKPNPGGSSSKGAMHYATVTTGHPGYQAAVSSGDEAR